MALGPVTVALAADNDDESQIRTPAKTDTVNLHREARGQLRLAENRAERKLERRRARRAKREAARYASPQLEAIAACESGGNPRAIGGGGAFRGKYQFTYGTWAGVGGKGDPAKASEAEQDKRAAILLAQSGTSPWPVCGA
jgi:hypothetical protein